MLFKDPRLAVFCDSCSRKGVHSLLPVGQPKSQTTGPLMEDDLRGPEDRACHQVTSCLLGKVPPPGPRLVPLSESLLVGL